MPIANHLCPPGARGLMGRNQAKRIHLKMRGWRCRYIAGDLHRINPICMAQQQAADLFCRAGGCNSVQMLKQIT